MKKKLTTLAVWCFVLSAVLLVVSYFMFHYLTDAGFTTVWHPEAGKPFVTEMVADLGVLFLFSGIMSLITARIFFPNEDRKGR